MSNNLDNGTKKQKNFKNVTKIKQGMLHQIYNGDKVTIIKYSPCNQLPDLR